MALGDGSQLTVAQVLADLNSLQNTDPEAALALLNANKALIKSRTLRRKSSSRIPSSPAQFDSLGRRVTSRTPPSLSRETSNKSFKSKGSGSGVAMSMSSGVISSAIPTPMISPPAQDDEDLKKARELINLYAMRGEFKRMGDTGLARARQRVDAVVEQYAQKELYQREKVAKARHLGTS